jgi:hypothetical protein
MDEREQDAEKLSAEAAESWKQGDHRAAIALATAALEADAAPSLAAFLQLAGFHFHSFQFDRSIEVLEAAARLFPGDPSVLKYLGGTLVRAHRYTEARAVLEQLIAIGPTDMHGYDALATALAQTGDLLRARLFGTMALAKKDKATAAKRDPAVLDLTASPAGKMRIISFSLFGSDPRYLRGALDNVLAARIHYPGWTCRFYVGPGVDGRLVAALRDEGAETLLDESSEDRRLLLTRRFLVNDDPAVGHFMVRDCDSVIGAREAGAVAEWLNSGLPFHVMRDWFTHTDVMLAGLWGGTAGVFPSMASRIQATLQNREANTNWDQQFLREEVWPIIRDHVMVHDRLFSSYRAHPFPGPVPKDGSHVGQNVHASDRQAQAARLASFAFRIPALGLRRPRAMIDPSKIQ